MLKPDKIVRSARKTLSVSVDALGKVTVRAPKSCSDERIHAFLQSKENWILRHKAQGERARARLPHGALDGYSLMLLGQSYTLVLTDEKTITFDEPNRRIYLPKRNAQTRLIQWLKDNALRIFTGITERRAREMNVVYKTVKVNSARSKWGCCTYDNELRYSFRLLYAPKEVIEYVVTHELAHVRHKNHSSAFWREVANYLPDYKSRRGWLKENRILMQIF